MAINCSSRLTAQGPAHSSIAHAGLAILAASALCVLSSALPAGAQDVKDLMGRSQSQSQQKAVEDLIRKLQGGTEARPEAAPSPAPKVERPRTASPATPVTPALPPPAAPAEIKPQIAVSPAPAPPAPRARDAEATSIEPDGLPPVAPPSPGAAPKAPPPAVAPTPAPRPAAQPAQSPAPPAPASPPPRVETARIDAMPSVDIEIYFDYNSDAVSGQAAATLAVLAKALSDPRLASARFLIAGHTDAKGGAQFNLELSERRAQSVRRFLIDQQGIDQSRLVAQGFGQQKLKMPSRPMDVQNRRVQVVNLTAAGK